MKTFFIFLLVWIVLSAVGYQIGKMVFNPSHLELMTIEGKQIYARVVAKEPENHQTIRYVFDLNGVEYTGSGAAGAGNPSFQEIQIGDDVVVFYNPSNPQESILGNPWEDLGAQYTGIMFSTIVFPILPMAFLLLFWFVIKASRKKKSEYS